MNNEGIVEFAISPKKKECTDNLKKKKTKK